MHTSDEQCAAMPGSSGTGIHREVGEAMHSSGTSKDSGKN